MQQKSSCASKVAIIGAGFVGSTSAYALMLNGTASHIALIDLNKEKAEGEALDLLHCMQFTHSAEIIAGDSFELVKDAEVVVITAGVGQKIGESRVDLLEKNVRIFKEIIPQIVKYNQDCTLLVVTNPLDVLTHVTLKLSGFPSCRVIGTGTVLDTARLRYEIGRHFEISPKDVSAYMLGEHGDSEFVWWSKAEIAGIPLHKFYAYSPELMHKIYEKTKNAADEIIRKKGATYYAIAMVVNKIVRAILLDQSRVFSVSSLVQNLYDIDDVCLSLPMVIRKGGTCQRLDLELNKEEQILLQASAHKIRELTRKALSFV